MLEHTRKFINSGPAILTKAPADLSVKSPTIRRKFTVRMRDTKILTIEWLSVTSQK